LAGLRLRQTHSGAGAPPICSSTVELDYHFGAEEMCLAEITTSALKNESLNRLPFFVLDVLAFFCCTLHAVHDMRALFSICLHKIQICMACVSLSLFFLPFVYTTQRFACRSFFLFIIKQTSHAFDQHKYPIN
jgi:hypothetical protein